MPPRAATLLVSAALLCATLGTARAGEAPPKDPTARAEWYSQRAELAFEAGRFNDAIKLYLDAYEAAPSASILYNVAFIYDRRLKEPELAIDNYERAAAAPDADQALVDKARARVKALRAELAKPPDKPPDRPPDKPPDVVEPPGDAFPFGPVATMAAGGGVLAIGVVCAVLASGTHEDFEAATSSADKRDLQSTGRTQALVADIGMAVGGATLVAGVLWLLLDAPAEDGAAVVPLGGPPGHRGLRVSPLVAPGPAGLTGVAIGGSF